MRQELAIITVRRFCDDKREGFVKHDINILANI